MQIPFLTKKTEEQITSYTYNGNSVLEIFLPSVNFERSNGRTMLSSRVGRLIDTVGIFYFFEGKDLYFFSLPINIQFEYTAERKQKSFKLNSKIPPTDYTVFTLRKGDKFIYNDIYILNVKDTNGILNTFYQAYLPSTIAYEDIYEIFSNAFFSTKMKFPAVSVLLEALLSQLYRSKTNIYNPFRLSYNGRNGYAYQNINIKKVPEVSSLFSSLVGEDGYYQLTQILANKDNKDLVRKNAIETVLDIQLEKE
jgi:hypothetical protein